MMIMSRPLGWFWLIGITLLVWNVIGLIALMFDPATGFGDISEMPETQQALYAARPDYAYAGFVLATVAGTAACIALLLRRNIAQLLFVLSAIGLVLQNAWLFLDTSYLTAEVIGFQALVAGSVALGLWLAATAKRRRWSR
ncbi:hypothetical protein [Blastomonas sp.]|uniref:hypothetical protein n=1 Tax=Blastomonas sp. TaxID=1909299 RepID=UPI003593EA08